MDFPLKHKKILVVQGHLINIWEQFRSEIVFIFIPMIETIYYNKLHS